MHTWIRTGLAVIAAGSIGLTLTACGSKNNDPGSASTTDGDRNTSSTIDGTYINVDLEDDDYIDVANIKNQRLTLISVLGDEKQWCQNLKLATKQFGGKVGDINNPGDAPYIVLSNYDISKDLTIITYRAEPDDSEAWHPTPGEKIAFPISIGGGIIRYSTEDDGANPFTFAKSNQQAAKIQLINKCGSDFKL